MRLVTSLQRSKAALAHWGVREYFLLAVLWLTLSTPLYLAGWGLLSVLSLPLLLLAIVVLTYGASALVKPLPQKKVQPKPGFPPSIEVPSLGFFPLSAYSDSLYERKVSWCGSEIGLNLSIEAVELVDSVRRVAVAITSEASKVNSEVTRFAVRELLSEVNEGRSAAGQSELTAEQFLQAISLQSITVHSDETYEFMYDDGELLGGHWIEVHGSLTQGPIDVDLPG
ncbi:MAG: DUF2262 domain-containing protein [Rhizobacter sp.]|nr:DUF2262 domain-containing protein [Rhizobacter sp.]